MISAIKREFWLMTKSGWDFATNLLYLSFSILLYPFVFGADIEMLSRFAPAIIWLSVLFMICLNLPFIYEKDYADGSMEQLYLAPYHIGFIIFAKIFSHSLVNMIFIFPVIILAGLIYNIEIKGLLLSIMISIPILVMVGGITSALALGAKNNGAMIAVISLPLYVAIIILGANNLYLLLIAIFLIMLPTALIASVYAIQLAINDD